MPPVWQAQMANPLNDQQKGHRKDTTNGQKKQPTEKDH